MTVTTNRRALLIDVDNTVLDTSKFHIQLSRCISWLLDVRFKTFLAEIPLYDTNYQGYRLDDHLKQYGTSLGAIRFRLMERLEKERLIYDDAYWALSKALPQPQTDVWLITTGDTVTQQFKIDLIKRILKLNRVSQVSRLRSKIISVGATKGNWLVRQWKNGHLVIEGALYALVALIDDNPIHFKGINETPGFIGLQIRRARANGEYRYEVSDKDFIHQITSLERAFDYLNKVVAA